MKRVLRYFWLPFVVAASACAFRANMDEAMSDRFLSPNPIGSDMDAEIAAAKLELEQLGYELIEQTYGLDRAATLHTHVLLPSGFEGRSKYDQLRILRHELTHARQWRGLGLVLFGSKYASESGRWVLEMHGYRQDVRDMCSRGHKREDIAAHIEARAESFPAAYHFSPKHRAKVQAATLAALTAELDLCEMD